MKNNEIEGNYIFDPDLWEKIKVHNPLYSIGVDNCSKDLSTYCFMKHLEDNVEILLVKTMRNKIDFNEEVKKTGFTFGG